MPRHAAYFSQIDIENVRCFGKRQTLRLTDDAGRIASWTIILGDNGTGKSTLLQALAASTPLDGELQREKKTRGHQVAIAQAFGHWRGEFVRTFTRSDQTSARIVATVSLTSPLSRGQAPAQSKDKIEIEWGNISAKAISRKEAIGFACFGYGVNRRYQAKSFSKFDERYDDVPAGNLLFDAATLRNAENWLLYEDYVRLSRRVTPSNRRLASGRFRFSRIVRTLLHILPGITDIKIRRDHRMQERARVMFKSPYGWVTIDQLGHGYKTTVAWVIDLASRMYDVYPESKDPLREPAVVLVDEIDLHLHPKWQRAVMSFLTERFPNVQFIATAHSPLVVQANERLNIAVLRRVRDHAVIDQTVENVRGWRVDQILTSDLFDLKSARPPQFEKLIAARQKILEKGKLNSTDMTQLQQLEKRLAEMPAGKSADDMHALSIINKAARRLESGTKRR